MAESLNMNVTLVLFISFFSGGLLLYIGDKLFNLFDKKLSKKTNKENKNNSFKRCLMLITSITLHNIPEGLAVGVAFGSIIYGLDGATLSTALLLALGIGLQNFPEGTAVSVPLRREGLSRKKAFFYGPVKWHSRTNIRCTRSSSCTKGTTTSSLFTKFCCWSYDLCCSTRINS